MKIENNCASDVKIAYIGGGSRGWAWGLMSDLAQAGDMSGSVSLYDIDFEAAHHNEIIGNKITEGKSKWVYTAEKNIGDALTGANFVVISILPGTFEEMSSDVHTPEKYGIFQSVGDTTGPGGIIRALRAIPMFEEIALAIKEYCPNAWVINYTNPMTVCIRTLYRVFPEIKAFGCCHEVFGTQQLLKEALKDILNIEAKNRAEIKTNVIGVNHFTWITKASYKNIDLFPVYREFVEKYKKEGYHDGQEYTEVNKLWRHAEKVKFDLFRRYGVIAAAGDRHLAEFVPGDWYLKSTGQVDEWYYGLTPVSHRTRELEERLARSKRLVSGEEKFKLVQTGEEGVLQMRAILGLGDICTNVNLPNRGQIPNLPMGAVVETNASFTANSVCPVSAGEIPLNIMQLVGKVVWQQECIVEAGLTRDLDLAFSAFMSDSLVRLPLDKGRELFNQMIKNTSKYLKMYNTGSIS